MIDPLSETLLTLTEAAKLLPGRPSTHLLWRWRTSGVRGVKLETVLVGGRRYTNRSALERFIERTTAAEIGEPVPHSSRQHARSHAAAKRELQATGGPVPT
jgi:hypothetical protein